MYNKLKKKYPKGLVFGLIAGHGGMKDGEYQIINKGSKQHTFEDGLTIYEGEQNHIIKNVALELAEWEPNLEVIDVIKTVEDKPLVYRVSEVNKWFNYYKKQGKLFVLFELHLNAFSNSKVSGKEVYTTRGNNFSDEMATVWWNEAEKLIPEQKDRPDYSDKDPDKEIDFFVIRNIHTFGVLIEFLFFTNREEVDKYLNPDGYSKLAGTLITTMKKLSNNFG